MVKPRVKRGCLGVTISIVLLVLGFVIFVFVQARREPAGRPEYVALGSSFAAGAGLGALQAGSPSMCARSVGGYPQQIAGMLRLSMVDMACGGAVTGHLLRGGQFFQGAQLRAVQSDTRLVTITVGGNDTLYIADLSQLAARNSNTVWGWLVRQFWRGPKRMDQRNFAKLEAELEATISGAKARAPKSVVVVATYPAILPPSATCPLLSLSADEADQMREVAARLAATTRAAAAKAGAIVVDMNALGAPHHACSDRPWTRGWINGGIAPFHPNERGAEATARAIVDSLRRSPAGVAAVGEDNASRH